MLGRRVMYEYIYDVCTNMYVYIEFIGVFVLCTSINIAYLTYVLTTAAIHYLSVYTNRIMGKQPTENKTKKY